MPRNNSVIGPNRGIYLDRPEVALDKRMLSDCLNVRIKNGKIIRDNMGYSLFMSQNLTDPVTMIDQFFRSDGSVILMFATTENMYQFNTSTSGVTYINPRYEIGSVSIATSATTAIGSGTAWTSVVAGDFVHFGATSAVSIDARWYEISSVTSGTEVILTSAISAGVSDSAYTIRRTFTGDVFDYWDSDTIANVSSQDLWFGTNGVDSIVKWNGTDTQVTLVSAVGFTCQTVAFYKEMLVCGNITEGGTNKKTTIKNSDVGAPEDFTNGLAGEFVAYDGISGINLLQPLGDNLVIYSDRSIVLTQFVGSPIVFVFRTAISGIGTQSGRALADFGDFHEFLGPDAQYEFNGIALEEIGSHVWLEVLRVHNPNKFDFFQGHVDEENGEVLWIVPLNTDTGDISTGQPNKAYSEHYLENVGDDPVPYTIRELPATATGYFERQSVVKWSDISDTWQSQNNRFDDRFFQAAFPFNLFGDENGNIFILNGADSQNGSDIDSFAQYGKVPATDGRRKGLIRRIYSFTEKIPAASYDLNVILKVGDSADDTMVAVTTLGHDLTHAEDKGGFVSPFKSARYFQLRYEVSGQGTPFSLAGYDVDISNGGSR